MNIFRPYTQVDGSPGVLHLKAGGNLRWVFFILYRITPAFIILLTAFVLVTRGTSHIPMGFNYLLVIAAVAGFVLLLRPYTIELQVSGSHIMVTRQTITGMRKWATTVADALCIKVNGDGNAVPATTFVLYTKAGRHFKLLSIPFWQADKVRLLLIAQTLEQLLHVEIKPGGRQFTAAGL